MPIRPPELTPVSIDALKHAAVVIKRGGVVAFPTETYYGLAVDPYNEKALSLLFHIKRRAWDKPILTLIDRIDQLPGLARETPSLFHPLIAQFWPGPLTLVFPAISSLSPLLTGDTGTVGVRISSHPVAQQLVKVVGQPITATSANLSGRRAAANRYEVENQLGRFVDLVLDGGETPGGPGSTIIGLEENRLRLIREGVVPSKRIFDLVGA